MFCRFEAQYSESVTVSYLTSRTFAVTSLVAELGVLTETAVAVIDPKPEGEISLRKPPVAL
jgi:hypothetical protein